MNGQFLVLATASGRLNFSWHPFPKECPPVPTEGLGGLNMPVYGKSLGLVISCLGHRVWFRTMVEQD